jgi:2-oxoglutarate ferredoxin oxidoreductase subunit delta
MPVRIWRRPLDATRIKLPKGEIHIIKERCKGCGFCIEFCPADVLDVGTEINSRGYHPPVVKNEEKCTCCGLCEIICPDFAIFNIEKN